MHRRSARVACALVRVLRMRDVVTHMCVRQVCSGGATGVAANAALNCRGRSERGDSVITCIGHALGYFGLCVVTCDSLVFSV